MPVKGHGGRDDKFARLYANDTLRRDWRNAKPRPAKPSSIIAQVEAGDAANCGGVVIGDSLQVDELRAHAYPPQVGLAGQRG
jgi:hypothetical protein